MIIDSFILDFIDLLIGEVYIINIQSCTLIYNYMYYIRLFKKKLH